MVILAPIAASLIQLAVSRQREYAADATGRPVLRQPGVAGLGAAAARGGREGDADAGQPGDRAALHRQAVQGRRDRRACSRPTRRSRSASGACARCARRSASAAASSYSVVVVTWECAEHLRTLVATMNAHLDGEPGADRRRQRVEPIPPRRRSARGRAGAASSRLRRNVGFGAASNVGVGGGRGGGDGAAQPRHRAARRRSRPARRRRARARRPGRPAGPEPRRHRPAVGERPRGRRLAVGAGAGSRGDPAGARSGRGPSRTGSTAGVEVELADRRLHRRPDRRCSPRLGPFDPALHMFGEDVDLGLRARAAGVRSWFDPQACRIVHHGQGSSTLAYGSREGWRPTGTAELARGGAPRLRAAARVARLAGPCGQPAPAPGREDRCSAARPTATARRSRPCSRRARYPSCRTDSAVSTVGRESSRLRIAPVRRLSAGALLHFLK